MGRTRTFGIVLAAIAALTLVAASAAIGAHGKNPRAVERCEERLARVAERRGVSVAELVAQRKERATARVQAALAAGRITAERAAKLTERIAAAQACDRAGHRRGHRAARGLLRAAADFLGLEGQLRAELAGTSLGELAAKQGKSVDALKAAMLAPAKEKVAKAVADDKITQERADRVLQRLGALVDRLVAKTFPAK